ncbi:hypothetical protein BLNAU_11197 [Blattamonas nauphoetae]|uniref:Uncharacterized protein n=1 Tax=Blattamonas nauphoetae TaxID=2049346 RepID=A0ABQ9XPY3_9EUKA|nr:hypothetical protein BLNAU_11197 [Blattamonas nauphoetae]
MVATLSFAFATSLALLALILPLSFSSIAVADNQNNFSETVVLQTHLTIDIISTARCGLDVCHHHHNTLRPRSRCSLDLVESFHATHNCLDSKQLKTMALPSGLKVPELGWFFCEDSIEPIYDVPLACIDAQTRPFLWNFIGAERNASMLNFVTTLSVLFSSASLSITTVAIKMIDSLIRHCSAKVLIALLKADLIPQLVIILHPHSLPFTEAVEIHTSLMSIIFSTVWLTGPNCLEDLEIEDGDGPQDIHETVLKQVLAPSEKYIWYLCVNRFSIKDASLSTGFMTFLANLIRPCPYYQPTLEYCHHLPIFLTIPSCLAFIENESSIWNFLAQMVDVQREWNKHSGEERQRWKTVHRMLRMEGSEDVVEEKLRNDKSTDIGRQIVVISAEWNNKLGMNIRY